MIDVLILISFFENNIISTQLHIFKENTIPPLSKNKLPTMIKSYLRSIHTALFSLQPSKATRSLLAAFFVFNLFFINNIFAQTGPNCPTICYGPGGSFSGNSLTITSNTYYSSISIDNNKTLTVKSGFTLYVGAINTAASTQVVDFQNGCTVVIESGASLIVNGLLNNSNNSNGVTFNGAVTVTGNVTAGSGSTIVGAGSLDATGTISGAGLIFSCNSSSRPSKPTITAGGATTFCTGGSVTLTSSVGTSYLWSTGATTQSIIANTSGNYTVKISNSSGCQSSSSSQITVIVSLSNTWTGSTNTSWFTPSNWSCGSLPTAATDVVIPNVINKPVVDVSSTIALANTLIVELGSQLIVNSSNTIKVTDKVTNNGGTITFEDSASLVQTNPVTNSGSIVYKRNISSTLTTDYTYWSSPVASQNLNLSPYYASGLFYSYNDFATPEDWQKETATTIMQIGKGYIVRGPVAPAPPGIYNATFTGVPNNGLQSIAVSGGVKSILIGNPYPSAIDADTFLSANSAAIDGTLYFWTHNTAIQSALIITSGTAGTGALAYTSNDYATYTLSGGVGTAGSLTAPEWVDANNNKIVDPGEWTDYNGNSKVDAVEWVDTNNNKVVDSGEWTDRNGDNILNLEVEQVSNRPTGNIAAGQGFFTTSTATGGLVRFTNTMRTNGSFNPLNNSNFFKTKNPATKTANAIEKHRVWLNLSNAQGAFKQVLVGYITDATNEFDSRFDGESFDGNEFVDFYSINQDKNLVIQGRALPFNENDEVPLGLRTTIKGDFTINIDQVDGLLNNQNVFIEDKLMNKTANLKEGNYTFNTTAGTFDDRFVLRYTDKTLSVEQTDKEDGILVLYSSNYKTLIIHNNDMYSAVNAVALFNITGQNISNWEVNDSEQTNIQFPIKNISSGVYIVKVKTTKGESSKKIIVR